MGRRNAGNVKLSRQCDAEFEHVIAFHITMDGWCRVYLTDNTDSAVRPEAGDALIIAGGESHIMGTRTQSNRTPSRHARSRSAGVRLIRQCEHY